MGIRFSKSIKLGDLFKVNISKSGVSLTAGKKGASVNVGTKGTYLNLSPSILGVSGTGVSYRKKLTGGVNDVKKLLNKDKNINLKTNNKTEEKKDDLVEDGLTNYDSTINIHKYAEDVIYLKEYDKKINACDNESTKEIYLLSKQGDEDTIESLVGSFMMNLDFEYPVKANYELEEHILYVDLDLPEIDNIKDLIKSGSKTQKQIKQEYANTVMSLSIYLTSNFFNLSPYIDQVIISGFTSTRNNNGDLVDQYLYSIKYDRSIFEKTKLSSIDDVYDFILKFENRIIFNESNYSFKSIKPYEMPSIEKNNSMIEDAISGLKELGYKNAVINGIIPKLNELKLDTSGEYLKEALKLLNK